MTDYLTMPEVLWVHADQIARYGGRPGMRGSGHLEAALFRPKTGHYVDLIEEAAALWESLAQYHPFIDGNERTAFASTYTFLTINGLRLLASAEETYSFISDLYPTNGFSFEVLVPWLRGHVDLNP
jgi:death-on-curing protein